MKSAPVRIIPDKKYPNMYRLQWENGDISIDTTDPKPWEKGGHYGFYNKTHATNILNNYDLILDGMVRSQEMQGNTRRRQTIGQALDCIP